MTTTATRPRLGWVGLGKMGAPMARNLLAAGHPLGLYNRSPGKAGALADAGAALHDSVAGLARASDVLFSMVADDAALRDVALGEAGAIACLAPGSVYIDMSTVSPAESARVADECSRGGVAYLRAPVSGSTALAASGALTILVSGPRDAYERCTPLLALLGKKLYHLGDAEQARYLKLSINSMVAITAAMMAEALTLSRRGAVPWSDMIEIINHSAVASPLIGYKAQMLERRDFAPMFAASQMTKDLDLALDAARAAQVPMPVAALVRQFFGAMVAGGRGEQDFFAYVTLLEELAGLTGEPAPTPRG